MSDFDLHCIKRRLDTLSEQVLAKIGWTDAAREAAAAAKAHRGLAKDHTKAADRALTKDPAAAPHYREIAGQHAEAAGHYEAAAGHYAAGDKVAGDAAMKAGNSVKIKSR